ncbi:polygranule-associated protein [Massilia sp. CCM 8733]|uniref:Polygranule-associated protein n=1 Tax=Massilia mucilaginosa TaxID=2609282 RepID=A0ABX0P3U4_9BURK|nr:phasin family protein [Massilia mucilaginosa]NHZ93485.1 polygranule-associated protein [Massilia mucilaginosa]
MTKKLKPQAVEDDSQLADAVRASAHQIWQAGLGAFAKAQEEGSRVFSKLVQEGNDLQKRTRSMAEDKAGGVADSAAGVAELVARQASGSWDKMEQVFEDRVTRALAGMGVPTQEQFKALALRVEELSRQVAELSGKGAPATAAAKPAAKTASKAPVRTLAAKPEAEPAAAKRAAKPAAKAPAKPAAQKAAKPAVKAAGAPRKRAAVKTPAPQGGEGA